jgi:hypothetical protein
MECAALTVRPTADELHPLILILGLYKSPTDLSFIRQVVRTGHLDEKSR